MIQLWIKSASPRIVDSSIFETRNLKVRRDWFFKLFTWAPQMLSNLLSYEVPMNSLTTDKSRKISHVLHCMAYPVCSIDFPSTLMLWRRAQSALLPLECACGNRVNMTSLTSVASVTSVTSV